MSTHLPEIGAAVPGEPRSGDDGAIGDPEVAEDYAASVGTDPTPEQIDHYLRLEGEDPQTESTLGNSTEGEDVS